MDKKYKDYCIVFTYCFLVFLLLGFLRMDMENDLVEETELSMDWIHDFEKMYSENAHYPREKMDKMNVYYLYVENGWITRMVPRKVVFMDSGFSDLDIGVYLKELGREGLSGFVKERLLETTELISSEEFVSREFLRMSEKKFVLSEMMLFNVDIEPENISDFGVDSGIFRTFSCFVGGGDGYEEFWGELDSLGGGFEWKDSVFIFHCLNAVYFVYHLSSSSSSGRGGRAAGLDAGVGLDVGMKVNPILVWDKPGRGGGGGGNNKTKRVHFPLEMGDDSDASGDDDSDAGDDSGDGVGNSWGKGKWLRRRRRNRTRKVSHVLNSSLIRQLFSS